MNVPNENTHEEYQQTAIIPALAGWWALPKDPGAAHDRIPVVAWVVEYGRWSNQDRILRSARTIPVFALRDANWSDIEDDYRLVHEPPGVHAWDAGR